MDSAVTNVMSDTNAPANAIVAANPENSKQPVNLQQVANNSSVSLPNNDRLSRSGFPPASHSSQPQTSAVGSETAIYSTVDTVTHAADMPTYDEVEPQDYANQNVDMPTYGGVEPQDQNVDMPTYDEVESDVQHVPRYDDLPGKSDTEGEVPAPEVKPRRVRSISQAPQVEGQEVDVDNPNADAVSQISAASRISQV